MFRAAPEWQLPAQVVASLQSLELGRMRTTTGAEHFAAIRSYIATAARQGIDSLDALIQAATGNPWIRTPA